MAVLETLKGMDEARFLAIYDALADQGFGPLDGEVAQALKFRPQAIRKLAFEKRALTARKLIEAKHNAELAYELFGTYLVRTRKDLVTGFLDATGVAHEDGMIENLEKDGPDEEKIAEAVNELEKSFETDDVTLYLALAAEQWPKSQGIQSAWRERVPATD